MGVVIAMGEIEAGHVHACLNQSSYGGIRGCGRTQSAGDFCLANLPHDLSLHPHFFHKQPLNRFAALSGYDFGGRIKISL